MLPPIHRVEGVAEMAAVGLGLEKDTFSKAGAYGYARSTDFSRRELTDDYVQAPFTGAYSQ